MSARASTLKKRFVFFVSAVIVLLSVVMAVLFYFNSRTLLHELLDSRASLITRQLAYGADVALGVNDTKYLQKAATSFANDLDVAFVIFRKQNGVVQEWYRYPELRDAVTRNPTAAKYNFRGYEVRHASMPITAVNEPAISGDFFDALGGEAQPTQPSSVPSVVEIGQVEVGISTENVHGRLGAILNKVILFVLVMTAVAIVFSYVFIDVTTRPLKRMVTAARNVAAGDLSETIDVASNNEIGDLAHSFNFMLDNLRDLFQRIRGASQSLAEVSTKVAGASAEVREGARTQQISIEEASGHIKEMNLALKETKEMTDSLAKSAADSSASIAEMTATIGSVDESMETLIESVRETNASIEDIVASIAEVSANVKKLITEAHDTSAAMQEIDGSIKQVESNSRETTALSEKVGQDAERGRESVQKTIAGINKIRESSQQIDAVIASLEEKTNRIGNILNVIDEIADQTNLLALNAAITAAQAGEQGKAFAVVADEIKQLADRTSRSTREIADLINAVQDESRNAVRAMELGNRSIEAGVELANAAGKALEEIDRSSKLSLARIREISRATNEQSKGSAQVAQAIDRIAQMCEKIGHAMDDQRLRSQQIVEAAARMRNIAEQVKNATRDQHQGSKFITEAIERINATIGHISRSTDEQSRGSDSIVRSVETIREITNRNQQNVANLEGVTETLNRQTEELMALVRRFKL